MSNGFSPARLQFGIIGLARPPPPHTNSSQSPQSEDDNVVGLLASQMDYWSPLHEVTFRNYLFLQLIKHKMSTKDMRNIHKERKRMYRKETPKDPKD